METNWVDLPYEDAASALADGAGDRRGPGAMFLLALLGYDQGLSPEERDNRVNLLKFAARMKTLLPFRGPDSPGFMFFLGMLDIQPFAAWDCASSTVSTNGAGASLGEAFQASVGEAIEYVSQFERGDERLVKVAHGTDVYSGPDLGAFAAMLGLDGPEAIGGLDWMPARRLGSVAEILLPADLCLRRRAASPPVRVAAPLSVGCAAAPGRDEAVLRGLLEVVERDAAALWWRGGRKAAAIPLDSAAAHLASHLLRKARGDGSRRSTWLLDITSDLQIPCVAAISVNPRGLEIACGLAAAISLQDAACSAVREMFQFELAYHLIAVKRHVNPDHAMSPPELRQMELGARVHADSEPLLHPAFAPRRHSQGPAGKGAELEWAVSRIEALGFRAFYVDLTRAEFGIPVAKVVVPGLQLDPSDAPTSRLLACVGDDPSRLALRPSLY